MPPRLLWAPATSHAHGPRDIVVRNIVGWSGNTIIPLLCTVSWLRVSISLAFPGFPAFQGPCPPPPPPVPEPASLRLSFSPCFSICPTPTPPVPSSPPLSLCLALPSSVTVFLSPPLSQAASSLLSVPLALCLGASPLLLHLSLSSWFFSHCFPLFLSLSLMVPPTCDHNLRP